jgi:hypothetical protein
MGGGIVAYTSLNVRAANMHIPGVLSNPKTQPLTINAPDPK